MTEMPDRRRDPPCRLAQLRVARALHDVTPIVPFCLLSLVAVSCVIPPPLSNQQQDAGVNSPPAITKVFADTTELVEPQQPGTGPYTFARGTGSLSIHLRDTDLTDTLYVRIFVEYNHPDATPPRSTCQAGSSKAADRTAICDISGVCETADVGVTRVMTIVVFDRMPQDTGLPLYQAMPDGADGQSTDRFYNVNCQ